MRIVALILGILGGIAGIFGGTFATTVGVMGQAFEAEGASTVTGLGIAAIPVSILAIIGGGLAIAKPKPAGILMLVSAVAGLIFVSVAYMVPFGLLIAGGVLALLARKEKGVQKIN